MSDRSQAPRDLPILALTVIVCALPFVGQAFHMDDSFYMDMARNAQAKPWFPNDLPYVFEGRPLPDMGSHSHPPFQTYFLALMQRLAGEGPGREWIYHAPALLFPILAVASMYLISARFLERPVWPALVLGVSPIFMIMQHTLMTDMPMLAFWLGCVASFLWAVDTNRLGLYVIAALSLFAALFTGYQAAALVPLLGYYQMRKGKGLRGWMAILLPVLVMAGWFVLNYFHYGRFLLGDTAGFIRSRGSLTPMALGTKVLALLQYQGWLIIFPLFPLLAFGRGMRGRLSALAALAAVYSAQVAVPHYKMLEKVIFVIGALSGGVILGRMLFYFAESFRAERETGRFESEDERFLILWYVVVAAACVFLFTEGSARYLLPLMPPLLIYFFRELELLEAREYRLPKAPVFNSAMIASGALVLSLAWGLALSHADREFSGIYPRAAAEASSITSGLTAYYAGEWGFRYYSRQAGMKQLPVDDNQVRGGSLVVRPSLALPYDLPAGLSSMLMPFKTLSFEVRTPLRILDRDCHAGFYSTGWGLLPFSFSRKIVERLEIGQVNYFVERLPSAEVESSNGVNPWPGYVTIEAKGPLAILAKPGTRIRYEWTEEKPLELALKVGVSHDSYSVGDRETFLFEIAQYDRSGRVISQETRTLSPGIREGDRKWQEAGLPLRGRKDGGAAVEFRYRSSTGSNEGIGAFAEAYLRPPK